MDELVKFHIKHKYFVNVNKTEDGCNVIYPANYLINPQFNSQNINYRLNDEGFEYITENYSSQYDIVKYARRFAVLTDIILKATNINIPNKLILIRSNNELKGSLIQILEPPTDQEDLLKEQLVAEVYADIVMGLFDYSSANKLGILRGYEGLIRLIESGGLL